MKTSKNLDISRSSNMKGKYHKAEVTECIIRVAGNTLARKINNKFIKKQLLTNTSVISATTTDLNVTRID